MASDHEEGLVEWAEVGPLGATCSRELGTGSVQTRTSALFLCMSSHMRNSMVDDQLFEIAHVCLLAGVVETRTLPGVWSATSVRLPNQRVLGEVPHSLLVVTEAEEAWACAGAEEWIVVARPEDLEAQVSAEAGGVTAEASEGGGEWTGEASEAVGDHPWTGWAAVVAEEWGPLEARWT